MYYYILFINYLVYYCVSILYDNSDMLWVYPLMNIYNLYWLLLIKKITLTRGLYANKQGAGSWHVKSREIRLVFEIILILLH